MERVLGIGGVFLKAKDPAVLGEWYRKHLGIDVQPWGGCAFRSSTAHGPNHDITVWSLFPESSNYFDPSRSSVMVNYRVRDLDALLAALRAEGCAVDSKTDTNDFGKFGWVMDPEGNRIELWQPPEGAMPG